MLRRSAGSSAGAQMKRLYGWSIVDRNGKQLWGMCCTCQERVDAVAKARDLNDHDLDIRGPYRVVRLTYEWARKKRKRHG